MNERGCSIPLVVRLRGVPDDGRLATMSETVARAVAGRLSDAAAVIAGQAGWNSYRAIHAPPVIRFSGGSLDAIAQRRVAAAIEVGIARAISSVSEAVAGSAPLRTPDVPRSQEGLAAARPPLDPRETETGWYLNGISVFKIQRPDGEAESTRLGFEPRLSVNGDGSTKLLIIAAHDADVVVQLQPDAVSQLTRLASEIDIREIVTGMAPEDGPIAMGASPSGATPRPAGIPERLEALPSRPTGEEFQQAVNLPLPAPPASPLYPQSVASPLLSSPGSDSAKIEAASPRLPGDEATDGRAAERDVPNDGPARTGLPGRGSRDDPNIMPRLPDVLSSGARQDLLDAVPKANMDDQPRQLTGTPEGGRGVGGLFDELVLGGTSEQEQKQVDRVIIVRSKTLLTEEEFAAGVARTRGPRGMILPYRKTGSEASPIYVRRLLGGKVRVSLRHDIFATCYASDRDLRLPPTIGTGVELNEMDVVGVKFVDEGTVSFFPAVVLMHLESEATRVALAKAGEAFAVGLTTGADTNAAAAAGGTETITTARRADSAGGTGLAWADRIALRLALANSRIQEHQVWIMETWPDTGRPFVSSMEQLTAYERIHGFPDGGRVFFNFLDSLRNTYQNWRAEANTVNSTLSEDDREKIQQIVRDTEELLRTIAEDIRLFG